MMISILLIVLVVFFSINMGGGNFAASFAAAHGGRILSKRRAQLLFLIFVIIGAVLLGGEVAKTIGNNIVPSEVLTPGNVCIMLFSASFSLFVANLLRIPQSTSFVTVGSLFGIGLFHNQYYSATFFRLLPFWIFMPVAGFLLTYLVGRVIYPPRASNFRLFEKLVNHHVWLKRFVIIASCYNALSVGSNNVANAVGPLVGAGVASPVIGMLLLAPVFGMGSVVFDQSLTSTSEKIVPLGVITASIICTVCGTLMIFASVFGIPQSFVMIKVASVVAIGVLKNGYTETLRNPIIRKTYTAWIITPSLAVAVSYLLSWLKHTFF